MVSIRLRRRRKWIVPDILERSAARHKHLYPRQVLAARMGLFAGELLGIDLPRRDKLLIVTAKVEGIFLPTL